jgi:hypothetical protein
MAGRAIRRSSVRTYGSPDSLKKTLRRSSVVDKGRKIAEPHIERIVQSLVTRATNDDSRDGVAAAGVLLDRLWQKPLTDTALLSEKFSLTVGSVADLRFSMGRIVLAVANRELPIGEGKEMLGLLERLLVIEQASAIDALRDQVDEMRRELKGGSRVISLDADVPKWGTARRRLEQAEDVEPITGENP